MSIYFSVVIVPVKSVVNRQQNDQDWGNDGARDGTGGVVSRTESDAAVPTTKVAKCWLLVSSANDSSTNGSTVGRWVVNVHRRWLRLDKKRSDWERRANGRIAKSSRVELRGDAKLEMNERKRAPILPC